MAFMALVIILTFASLFAVLVWLMYHGKIVGLTSGRLTYSPFMRIFGRVYPIILLAALIGYYALPFDHLYRAGSYIGINFERAVEMAATESSHLNRILEEDIGVLDDASWTWETAELPFTQSHLEVASNCVLTNRLFISQVPAKDGTLTLHYYPGELFLGGYPANDLLQPRVADFICSDDGILQLKDMPADDYKRRSLSITQWTIPNMTRQFEMNVKAQGYVNIEHAILIIQVPEGTRITYQEKTLDKGMLY